MVHTCLEIGRIHEYHNSVYPPTALKFATDVALPPSGR